MGVYFFPDFYGVYVDVLQWRDDVTLYDSGLVADGNFFESDGELPLSEIPFYDGFYDMDAIFDKIVEGTSLIWITDDAGYGVGYLPSHSWNKRYDGVPSTLEEAENVIKSTLRRYFKEPITPIFYGS